MEFLSRKRHDFTQTRAQSRTHPCTSMLERTPEPKPSQKPDVTHDITPIAAEITYLGPKTMHGYIPASVADRLLGTLGGRAW